MRKLRIRLVHWVPTQAMTRVAQLRKAGFQVHYASEVPKILREIRTDIPDAIVIDLSRLPSHGREIGVFLRRARRTRLVPIIFADGEPAKIRGIRALLPDATYARWQDITGSVRGAIANPADDVIVPQSGMAAYAGVPLARKLGIRPAATTLLVHPPQGFRRMLGTLPRGARVTSRMTRSPDLILWFTRSVHELEQGISRMRTLAGRKRLWIIWPKKSSRIVSDLVQSEVRRIGLTAGLVDYKIAAIDSTWSGLLFTLRERS